jgi:hypothetical protein
MVIFNTVFPLPLNPKLPAFDAASRSLLALPMTRYAISCEYARAIV